MITSVDEFIRLRTSQDPEEYNRAANEELAPEVWLHLAIMPDMRVWAVRNKTVPIEILQICVLDNSPQVRIAIAMKNKLTENLFDKLSQDEDSAVRHAIVCNRNVPKNILERLVNDPWEVIAKKAKAKLEGMKSASGGQ